MRNGPSHWEHDANLPAAWRVLGTLLRLPAVSQAELRAHTGLSHPIIVQQVARLRRAGLIALGAPVLGQPGRPPVPIGFNWHFRRILAIQVDREAIHYAPANLAGVLLAPTQTITPAAWTRDALRHALFDLCTAALTPDGIPWAGIGIAIPGTVLRDEITIQGWYDIPEWQDEPFGGELAAHTGLPVYLASSAVALAGAVMAEVPQDTNLMAVTLRAFPYIQFGLLNEGEIVRGATDAAGDLNHYPIAHHSALSAHCGDCGRSGCLGALFRAVAGNSGRRLRALHALGDSVTAVAHIVDPSIVVMQGDANWTEGDGQLMREMFTAHGFSRARRAPRMIEVPYDGHDLLRGIVKLVSTRLLDFRTGLLASWCGTDPPAGYDTPRP